jgi:hypothetical protein
VEVRVCPDPSTTPDMEGDAPHRGPCLALYADRGQGPRLFSGQAQLFADLARLGTQRGVSVLVLTPGDWSRRTAYRWHAGGWKRGPLDQPDIVLRRSGAFGQGRLRIARRELEDLSGRHLVHTLPRECSDKWRLYGTLRKVRGVRDHVPLTALAHNAQDVWRRVRNRGDVYVKPVHGDKGRQVIRLQALGRNQVRLMRQAPLSVSGPESRGSYVLTLDAARWSAWWSRHMHGPCVVQDTVEVLRIGEDRPVDFRWLIQWDGQSPTVVARVARVGEHEAVTTNVHTGGAPVWAEKILRDLGNSQRDAARLLKCMDELSLTIARHLRDIFGPYAECGLDLALDRTERVFLLEVNPTPGRRMLRLLDPAVRQWSLELLLEYAIRASGFADGQI